MPKVSEASASDDDFQSCASRRAAWRRAITSWSLPGACQRPGAAKDDLLVLNGLQRAIQAAGRVFALELGHGRSPHVEERDAGTVDRDFFEIRVGDWIAGRSKAA